VRKRHFYAIGFSILVAFDTLIQVSMKLASTQAGEFAMNKEWLLTVLQNPWLYSAIAGYLGAFGAWMTLLKHAPVGPAYAASHLCLVTVLGISVAYFGEHLSVIQFWGALSIILGIVFFSLSELRQPHI